ncbi:TRAP transporter small permease [Desulforhopalus singaporensis]|uniref:TRAP-type C4-dicarboxylate transport system, small permease component n=1 Tax=Desulforhopalus singaporensis TaxID=91360 RepID=A0A1H0IUB3_9BACT|nr:TRAP transporter small permease [Desulforhopalus singaporensis]SDO34800.1 TRAP-type C4-dicarboxylate transport system, small permease component [Desulforhopalus singaporensis]
MHNVSALAHKIVRFGIKILVCSACATLAAMMFLMAADVVGRYFFNAPIPGGLELVEYMMAVIVPFSIAYCALQKSHVAVDLVVDRLPRPVRRLLGVIVTCLSILFVAVISWENIAYIGETYRSNLTSAVLKIPAFPFVAAVAIGMSVFCIVLVVQLLEKFTKEDRS